MEKIKKLVTSLSKGTDHTLCILNGVLGDILEKGNTPLAMKMKLYVENKPVSMTKKSLSEIKLSNNKKICILAHGSCGSIKGWNFKEDPSNNYGSLLKKEKEITPFFLRYNSGLHISTNGKRLSDLLEKLVCHHPEKISELVLVGHSMGGLVFRSACHYGQKEKRKWVKLVTKIFYLGSPHLGTHLEKLGKLTTTVLSQIPNPVTKAIVSLGNLRSAGIKDLRHGYLIDEDWQQKNADNLFYRHENRIPLLDTADHYLICGTLSKVADSKMGRFFGDGMVHPASGMGRGLFSSNDIPFLKHHCKIILGISHARLQRSPRVYEQIREWM
ncbi:MAG TPA: hypothetical protein DDW49_06670 [Deltaproteobacteria bacterium]|nr:MAG: hypothetical protein A2048_02745 [Deltaproteobacteria bacterium GWA2_45_12]HBF13054.1 hypothetical protein [Deltaproteobacteria bacterium]